MSYNNYVQQQQQQQQQQPSYGYAPSPDQYQQQQYQQQQQQQYQQQQQQQQQQRRSPFQYSNQDQNHPFQRVTSFTDDPSNLAGSLHQPRPQQNQRHRHSSPPLSLQSNSSGTIVAESSEHKTPRVYQTGEGKPLAAMSCAQMLTKASAGILVYSLVRVLSKPTHQEGTNQVKFNASDGTYIIAVSICAVEVPYEVHPGAYVAVWGSVRREDTRILLNAVTMRMVTDFNELTYHMLSVIRDSFVKKKPKSATNADTGGHIEITQFMAPVHGDPLSNQSPIQRQLLAVLEQYEHSQYGAHIEQLAQAMPNLPRDELLQMLEDLGNDGLVYEPVDGAFKSAFAAD